jgi:hypothetical protein
MNTDLNESIQDKVFFFTERLNQLVGIEDNTDIPKTIKKIDKLVNNLFMDLYGLVDGKKLLAIPDTKCGHCG